MTEGSNTAAAIAEARKRITSNKGKIKRRENTIADLRYDIRECSEAIRRDQALIREMGGKVRS